MRIASTGHTVVIAAVASFVGCGIAYAQTPASYMYTLMVNIVGPAANSLRDDAAKHPLRDEDWERLRQSATTLMQSRSQISFGGTMPAEEQRATSLSWQSWADNLSNSVLAVTRAINSRDQEALSAAGGDLHRVCAGCHTAFPPAIHCECLS